jgi:hypothetical protein
VEIIVYLNNINIVILVIYEIKSMYIKNINILFVIISVAMTDNEEPYPSLSDYHDYEPNLEFDDTELQSPTADIGKVFIFSLLL